MKYEMRASGGSAERLAAHGESAPLMRLDGADSAGQMKIEWKECVMTDAEIKRYVQEQLARLEKRLRVLIVRAARGEEKENE
nr:MAG TPA: hypothetical protein [Caudoviricetes sp.]